MTENDNRSKRLGICLSLFHSIDGRETEHPVWTHVKSTRTIQNRQRKTARMLFNAAIQNAGFVVREPLKKKIRIEMPPVDEAFEAFARHCQVTNGS